MPSHDPAGAIIGGLALIWILPILIAAALSIFWVVEIIDVLRREFNDTTMKIVWLLVVVFLHGLGAIIYYFVGKPTGVLPNQSYPRT